MFSKPLMTETALDEYTSDLEVKSDDELVSEVRSQVYSAAFLPRHSVHDQKATKCWEESERRQKPWLYQRGYNSALREAGETPNDYDIEKATEEHYRKESDDTKT